MAELTKIIGIAGLALVIACTKQPEAQSKREDMKTASFEAQIQERFLKYVQINTASDENSITCPSTTGQWDLARYVKQELASIGLTNISLDENCYLFATLPGNSKKKLPTIGFISHFDTSPDMPGDSVKPRLIEHYDGKNIPLNATDTLLVEENPTLLKYIGQPIIHTDGTTLLGADDKAGIAAIVSAVAYLKEHPEIEHGDIRIGFTPDEEIGRGADKFDVQAFNADFAYTIDGEGLGSLEYENFNAASVSISIQGTNVHPGYAKNKMVNAIHVAHAFDALIPNERPENTEGYEGYFHLMNLTGTVEKSELAYIIRDHDKARFQNRKKLMQSAATTINKQFGDILTIEITDSYYNMREKIEPQMHIVEKAEQAMRNLGIEPEIKPIRGGTDGSRLSFMGLPCPNIFAGGHNFHSRYEYLPVNNMVSSSKVIIELVQVSASEQ